MAIEFTLNGKRQSVDVDPQMPLLWVLRDTLGLTGTKFGCGMALCGACTVHINGNRHAHALCRFRWLPENPSPLSKVFPPTAVIRFRRPGSKLTFRSAATASRVRSCRQRRFWRKKSNPTDSDIDEAMRGNICRCGTYQEIREAIHRAAQYAKGGPR